MSARWMFMVLLGCRLLHASQLQSSCNKLERVCVPAGANVTVACPWSATENLRFNLFKDDRIVEVHHRCSSKGSGSDCEPNGVSLNVEVQEKENGSISFLLIGVNASSHGVYRCEGLISYPPPLEPVPSDLDILVLVKGHQCDIVCKTEKRDGDKSCGLYWVWILAALGCYGVIATCSTIFFWVKLRRTDSQSDYMNTKPKPIRERRKKRGVQLPSNFYL